MSPAFSTYLHIVRFSAAFIVFAHHASLERNDGRWISWLSNYGHEAVVVFFVLSGYVIAFSTDRNEGTPSVYFASRLSRLWSVVIPALVITAAFDWLGQLMAPAVYPVSAPGSWLSYLTSGLFLNQIWTFTSYPGTNDPFWSLSYEFMYYLIFAAWMFYPRRRIVLFACLLLAGPKILLLLPAWLLGCFAYRKSQGAMKTRQAVWFAGLGALLALGVAISKVGNYYISWRWGLLFGEEILLAMAHADAFFTDNIIALGIALHFVGMTHLLRNISVAAKTAKTIQKIADSTFCIYLIHYPALYFFSAVSVYLTGEKYGIFIGVMSFVVAFLATQPTERLRREGRRWLLNAFGNDAATMRQSAGVANRFHPPSSR